MGTPRAEEQTVSTNRKKLIKEQLAQGKDAANQLMDLFQQPFRSGELHVLAEDLLVRIQKSFAEPLSALSSASGDIGLSSGTLSEDQRSEGSSESRKRPAFKDKRGCYKRRCRKNGETRTEISPSIEDGQAWRKYGQKDILHSNYPRAYFRCTRKYDQGCKATKQVQKLEDNPQLFHITYIGNHTCKDVLKAPQIITDSDHWKSVFVCSDANTSSSEQNLYPLHNTTVKNDEYKEDSVLLTQQWNNDNIDISSSKDPVVWPQDDLFSMETSDITFMSNKVGSVYSYTDTSSHSMDMDDFADFDSAFYTFG